MGIYSKKQDKFRTLEPDEVFLDSRNIPGFERERFEGRLERPLSLKTFWYLGASLFILGFIFIYKSFQLQIVDGKELRIRAEANRLRIQPLWPERGLILDRNGEVMANNEPAFRIVLNAGEIKDLNNDNEKLEKLKNDLGESLEIPVENFENAIGQARREKKGLLLGTFFNWEDAEKFRRDFIGLPLSIEPFSSRNYVEKEATSHILGYLGKPSPGNPILNQKFYGLLGKGGVEAMQEESLKGKIGSKLTEIDSSGEISSEAVQEPSVNGGNIYLSIDFALQKKAYESVKEIVTTRGFRGGSAIIIDVENGEVLTLVSYPGFDAEAMSRGKPRETIENILNDNASKPLFNRAISGLYASGSIFKPILAIAGLEENIITPEKKILSTKSIAIPNPYDPSNPSIFYDSRENGWVDMRRALALSSNIYFYSVGGGLGDVKGLGVKKIGEWAAKFGLGELTNIDLPEEKKGFIPGPEWKKETNKVDPIWRLGDTYNLSIGQGNVQVTPLQMAVVAAAIANGGKVLEPHVLKYIKKDSEVVFETTPRVKKTISIKPENLKVVHEGMVLTTSEGTAKALGTLKFSVAAKTGTAEIDSVNRVNSWFIGFFPAEKPKYAMAVSMESGASASIVGASAATRQILEWLSIYRSELIPE